MTRLPDLMPQAIADAIILHGGDGLPWEESASRLWSVTWFDECISIGEGREGVVRFSWETPTGIMSGLIRETVNPSLSRRFDDARRWHSRPPRREDDPKPSLIDLPIVERLRSLQTLARRPSICAWVSEQLGQIVTEMEAEC